MIIIAGYMIVDEANRDEFVDAHRGLVARARAFDGCIDLAISPDPLDPARINNPEVWQDADALDSWRAQADPPRLGGEPREVAMKRYDASDGGPLF